MNPYRRYVVLMVCASLLFISTRPTKASASGKVLIGHVFPDTKVSNWRVLVCPEVNGQAKDCRYSLGSDYFYEADENTSVTLIFHRDSFWAAATSIDVTATMDHPHWMAPDVFLAFMHLEEEQGRSLPIPGRPRDVSAVSHHAQETEEQKKAREKLRARLVEQAKLAQRSKVPDIFQYNLEMAADLYRNDRALQEDIAKFKTDPAFANVTTAPAGRAELYRKMVQRSRGEVVEIDPESLIKLADDPSVPPPLRERSVRTMTDTSSLEFLRKKSRDPSSGLYVPAIQQLIKVGTNDDRTQILKDLEGPDTKRTISILTAMEGTQWTDGRAAVSRMSTSTNVQPVVREWAKQSYARLDQDAPDRSARMVDLSGPLKGSQAELNYRRRGTTTKQIDLVLRNVQPVRGVAAYVLWAAVGEGHGFVRLGQVLSASNPRARIYTETSLPVSYLLLTAEESELVTKPSGEVVANIKVP